MSSLDPSAFHETIILPHEQVCFDLLQCVKYNTHHDQQRSTTEECRKALSNSKALSDTGKDTDNGEENSSGERDPVHDLTNEICSGLSRLYARYETIALLQAVRHLLGVKDQRCIKEGKTYHHNSVDEHIPEVTVVIEDPCDTLTGFKIGERDKCRQEHDRLGEDDGHYTSGIHLQRKELPGTGELPVTHDLFSVVDGYFPYTLYQDDQAHDNGDQECDLHQEDQEATTTAGLLGSKLPEE